MCLDFHSVTFSGVAAKMRGLQVLPVMASAQRHGNNVIHAERLHIRPFKAHVYRCSAYSAVGFAGFMNFILKPAIFAVSVLGAFVTHLSGRVLLKLFEPIPLDKPPRTERNGSLRMEYFYRVERLTLDISESSTYDFCPLTGTAARKIGKGKNPTLESILI